MKDNKTFYYAYWNGFYLCCSDKLDLIKKYTKRNRKINDFSSIDIHESNHLPTADDAKRLLCKKYGNLYTVYDMDIISKDFNKFIDEANRVYYHMIDMCHYNGETSYLRDTIKMYGNLVSVKNDEVEKMLKKFFKNHQLVNMTMPSYVAYCNFLSAVSCDN